ncbi:metal dependent phosphohydrolase [Tolumonas auensis DSM 9187]|uniref:5'-deoxynucleotidase n=1 Tax=Tolumonas auensis (strain DSM 9187 / NBRC 110442 / TA 4) TaxID=595494 RepID=C4LB80_TOLAT|nr:metal dependent phosphohydrolase [Tolumonas auensis DSM 9187]
MSSSESPVSTSHFFAQLSRMKLIYRWPLMRNIQKENISEHSLQVAMVAHALALISNRKFGTQLDAAHIALMAMFHDATEIITGDLPTPVKYQNNAIATEYKKIEKLAEKQLLSLLPDEFIDDYRFLLDSEYQDAEEAKVVKAADTLCAYIKCLEEIAAGNKEFVLAKRRLEIMLEERMTPAVQYFIDVFIPSFSLTLDEMSSAAT